MDSENTAALIAAAGGSRAVTFEESQDWTTFTIDDVECEVYEEQVTPTPQEWVRPENRLYAILNGEDYYLGNSQGKILLFTSQETEQCITLSDSEGSWVFSEMFRGVPPTAESESADEEWSTNDTCTFTVGGVEYTMQIYNYQSNFITPNNIMTY